MTTKVVSVTGHVSYKQIAQLLHEHQLTALPVLTPEGRVAGVVSEADLLRKQERQERTGWRPGWELDRVVRAKTEALTASGLMTSPAVTIGPDALLGTAARLMNQRHIKRLPVADREGKLIGIVSRADLLRVFLRPDAEIAAEASAVLTDIFLADPSEARATARDGVVTLAGRLASQDRTEAAVRLTEAINGVVAVTSKLTAPPSENWPPAGYHITNRDLAWDMPMAIVVISGVVASGHHGQRRGRADEGVNNQSWRTRPQADTGGQAGDRGVRDDLRNQISRDCDSSDEVTAQPRQLVTGQHRQRWYHGSVLPWQAAGG
jgi:CBS-domain-containing membrane protein